MVRRTPIVGLTTYYAEAAWSSWRRPAAVLPAPYFELVAAAGARPILLPPVREGVGGAGFAAAEVVAALDALILSGGPDVDPARYGARSRPETDAPDPDREESERALLLAALDADLPVLGICRGLQVLNVALGGTLHQHLPEQPGNRRHRPCPGQFAEVTVATVPGTRLAAILGDRDDVRCSHHQAVDRLGAGLVVSATSAEPDGSGALVEGLELPDRRFVVGVQWHPEESGDPRLFRALVAAV